MSGTKHGHGGSSGGNGPQGFGGSDQPSNSSRDEFRWQSTNHKWSEFSEYKTTVVKGEPMAEIMGRYYRLHAIGRMGPRGLGMPAGTQSDLKAQSHSARSISPRIVEYTIQHGTLDLSYTFNKEDNPYGNKKYNLGDVYVITSNNDKIVRTVYYEKY